MTNRHKHSFDEFSSSGRYRYAMGHIWGGGRKLVSIALNPSIGSSAKNDPTNTRLERRARAMNLGGVIFVNLFPFIAAKPADLKRAADPYGGRARSFNVINEHCVGNFILCGWGVHGTHLGRGHEVETRLRARGFTLHALDLTKDGHPKHPLYIAYEKRPFVWER